MFSQTAKAFARNILGLQTVNPCWESCFWDHPLAWSLGNLLPQLNTWSDIEIQPLSFPKSCRAAVWFDFGNMRCFGYALHILFEMTIPVTRPCHLCKHLNPCPMGASQLVINHALLKLIYSSFLWFCDRIKMTSAIMPIVTPKGPTYK